MDKDTGRKRAVKPAPQARMAGRAPSAELLTERDVGAKRLKGAPRARPGRRTPSLSALSLSRCAHRLQLALCVVAVCPRVRRRQWVHPSFVLDDGTVYLPPCFRRGPWCARAAEPLFGQRWCMPHLWGLE